MKKILLLSGVLIFSLFMVMEYGIAKNYTGCYICKGKSGTYVKYVGSDTFDKRKKAKKLGCDVGGYTSSCDAANYTILGTVN